MLFRSQLKVHLGPNTKHNTYEAEIIGAMLAVWLIRGCVETLGKVVSIYIDNQAVLSTIINPRAKPGQYLARHLNSMANELLCVLGIHWTSSHSKVRGNEKVDELVKEAADGRSSARARLLLKILSQLDGNESQLR